LSSPTYKNTVTVGTIRVDVVIVKEQDGYWFAQCLQLHNVSRVGSDAWRALESITKALQHELAELQKQGVSLDQLPGAPQEYLESHRQAENLPV